MNEAYEKLNKQLQETVKGGWLTNSFSKRVKKFAVTAMAILSILSFAQKSASAQQTPENIRQIEQNVITWGRDLQTMPEDKKQEFKELLVKYTTMYMQEMIDELKEYIRAGRYREALSAVRRIENMAEIVEDEPLLKLARKYEMIIKTNQEINTTQKSELIQAIIAEVGDVKIGEVREVKIGEEKFQVSKARSKNLSTAQRMAENQIMRKLGKSTQIIGTDVARDETGFTVTVIRKSE